MDESEKRSTDGERTKMDEVRGPLGERVSPPSAAPDPLRTESQRTEPGETGTGKIGIQNSGIPTYGKTQRPAIQPIPAGGTSPGSLLTHSGIPRLPQLGNPWLPGSPPGIPAFPLPRPGLCPVDPPRQRWDPGGRRPLQAPSLAPPTTQSRLSGGRPQRLRGRGHQCDGHDWKFRLSDRFGRRADREPDGGDGGLQEVSGHDGLHGIGSIPEDEPAGEAGVPQGLRQLWTDLGGWGRGGWGVG